MLKAKQKLLIWPEVRTRGETVVQDYGVETLNRDGQPTSTKPAGSWKLSKKWLQWVINRWQWTCWGRRLHFPVEGQWTGAGTNILSLCCPQWQVWSVCQSLEPVQQPSGSMSRQFQWQLGRRDEYPQDHNTWRTYWQPLYRLRLLDGMRCLVGGTRRRPMYLARFTPSPWKKCL